ncbi:oxidoreductase [Listeria floridensis FSL S10-1187]|uniref:Oxidoreductase n=1 Tax=Listeria floridensis FSL S10-1187 TaxID=1265817 RepID=A0ABN0RIX9_9LIST|nr:oxidoreductase [Listeria floridensis FSL S10-1187]
MCHYEKTNHGFLRIRKKYKSLSLAYLLERQDRIFVKTIYNPRNKPELEKNYPDTMFTTKVDDVLKDEEIDFISICTPAFTHYELAKICLEHGKNVMIEKPFCETLREAKELIELANEKGLLIMPFQNRRFDGDYLAVKQVLDSGKLGELIEIESHFDYYRPDSNLNKGPNSAGAVYGLGIHLIDQMVALFGRPQAASYDIRSIRNPENPDDYFEINLFYSTWKTKLKSSSLVLTPYPKFIVHGTKGSFVKHGIDRQEKDLKAGIMPGARLFGQDFTEHYGTLSYIAEDGTELTELVETPLGDYGRVYDAVYDTLLLGKEKLVQDSEILTDIEILERGFEKESPSLILL